MPLQFNPFTGTFDVTTKGDPGDTTAATSGTAAAPGFAFASDPNTGIYNPGADQLALSTNGTGRLFVNSDGSIQFGNPSATRLQVAATSSIGDSLYSYSSNYYIWGFRNESNSLTIESAFGGNIIFKAKQDGVASSPGAATERLRITSTGQLSHIGAGSSGSPAVSFSGSAPSNSLVVDSVGNVGIKTSSPQAALEVGGAGQLYINQDQRLQWNIAGGTTIRADIRGTSSNAIVFGNRVGGVLTDTMILDGSGRLGIGTSSPAYGLEVNNQNIAITNRPSTGTDNPVLYLRRNVESGDANIVSTHGTLAFQTDYGINGTFVTSSSILAGSPGDNTNTYFAFSTTNSGGTFGERMRLTSTGLGIGTTSPQHLLDCTSIGRFTGNTNSAASGAGIEIGYDAGNTTGFIQSYNRGSSTYLSTAVDGSDVRFKISGTERARIDSSGRLLVGTSSSYQVATGNPGRIQSVGETPFSGSLYSNDVYGPIIALGKSRGTSPGSFTSVINGDNLGAIRFAGADGVSLFNGYAAQIEAYVDGTPGANDMPGRLVFSTTADGAASPTERMRITSAGVLQVADAGNIAVGTTTGTKIGTATTQKLGFFNKTPVVQPAAVADATDAASVITQLNALLARMRDLGLIAT